MVTFVFNKIDVAPLFNNHFGSIDLFRSMIIQNKRSKVRDDLFPVPSRYLDPTRYPVFLSIPDPTRFSFENHQVAGNPKYRVLPGISGKHEVLGITRYFGYSQT